MASDFNFDPKDIQGMFNDRRGTRIQAQQSLQASLKDYQRSQQAQGPKDQYPKFPRPPMAR
jgi:hypothetical protein